MADYSANIAVRVENLNTLTRLDDTLKSIQKRVDKLNRTALKIQSVAGVSGSRADNRAAATQSKLLKEQTAQRLRQINLIADKARGLKNEAQIMDSLRAATNSIVSGQADSVRLGQAQLKTANDLLKDETARLKAIDEVNAKKQKVAETKAKELEAAKRVTEQEKIAARLNKERSATLLSNVRLVQQQAAGLANQSQILSKLRTATNNIVSAKAEGLSLGQRQLQNAKALVAEETKRAREIEKANQLLAKEKRQRFATAQDTIRQGPVAGNDVGAGVGAAAGFAFGGALAQAKEFQELTAAARMELSKVESNVQKVSTAQAQVNKLQDKINDNAGKQAANAAELVELEKKRSTLQGQVTRATNQQAKDLGEAEDRLSAVNKRINAVNSSQRGLQPYAEKWNRELTEAKAELQAIENELDDVARKQAKVAQNAANRARAKQGRGKAALAGLAFANVPGQDLFQAGAAGALLGGPAGAAIAAGAAALAKAGVALGNYSRQAAIAAAETQKLRIALSSIAGPETPEALKAIQQVVDDYNTPIDQVTRNFTQLTAAAKANGNSVSEVENLYRGLSSAVKATGGDTEDLNGVMRAATQVLSKGRVQAEELVGQIGDRLPGAFSLFAEAVGKTPQQLSDALRKGEITAEQFITNFASLLREKFEPAAKRIADSPAEAGARLEKNLTALQNAVGTLLGPIGAAFQDTFSQIVKYITQATNALINFLGIGVDGAVVKAQAALNRATKNFEKFLGVDRSTLNNRDKLRYDRAANQVRVATQRLEKALAEQRKAQESVELTKPPGVTEEDIDPKGTKVAIDRLLSPAAVAELRQRTQDALNANQLEINAAIKVDDTELERELKLIRDRIPLELEIETLQRSLNAAKGNPQAWMQANPGYTQESFNQAISQAETQIALRRSELTGTTLQQNEALIRASRQQIENQSQFVQRLEETRQKYQAIFAENEQAEFRQREINRLVMEGYTPALAEALVSVQEVVAEKQRELDADIAILKAELAKLDVNDAQKKSLAEKIKLLEQERDLIAGQGQNRQQKLIEQNSPQGQVADAIGDAQKSLRELQNPMKIAIGAAQELGQAFGDAFKNIVNGSQSAQEAFANMTKRMADYFLELAAKMVAEYVTLITLQAIYRALGGPPLNGGGGSSPGPINGVQNFGNLGTVSTGMQMAASGGRTRPGEPIIVGERGPEIFTPDSSGSIGSNRYFDAARDSMSIDADAQSSNAATEREAKLDNAAETFYQAASKPLELETTVINSVEYATVEQVRKSANSAVQEARAKTIHDLRNHPSRRGQIGMR